jgi:transposase InsO family protein
VEKDKDLVKRIHELADENRRSGYRMIHSLLCQEGRKVNLKKVHRIWKEEGLQVPTKGKKKKAKGQSKNGIAKRKASKPNDIWSYDFLFDRTIGGKQLKIMPVIDEFTRRCLGILVAHSITGSDVISFLEELFELHGLPAGIRSDNGSEFAGRKMDSFLTHNGVERLLIQPGAPWENGYTESFNSRLRDEILNYEEFYSLLEAQVYVEEFRVRYNDHRPHGGLKRATPSGFYEEWMRKKATDNAPGSQGQGRFASHTCGVTLDSGACGGKELLESEKEKNFFTFSE